MPEVCLALGSNTGDRAQNLLAAVAEIKKIARLLAVSSVYESKPQGFIKQPDFYNAAVKIETDIPPLELLKEIKNIERRLGRTKTFRNGPRVIDIDIIFYGNMEINTEELTVPHPRYPERDFVILPLAEINPAINSAAPRFKSVVKIIKNLL